MTQTDINTYLMHEGGAWTTWTPTLTQSGTVTCTVTRAVYARAGRLIHFTVSLAVTGTGTGAANVTISCPVTAAASAYVVGGAGRIFDSSASFSYQGTPYMLSTTTIGLLASSGTGVNLLGNSTFTAALASGDIVDISGFYESAS